MDRHRLGTWIVIAVLSVITLTLYVDNKRTRDCISNYMVADQKAAAARAEIADGERQFFKTVLGSLEDEGERKLAIAQYVALLNKDDQIREANPIKPVPTDCD